MAPCNRRTAPPMARMSGQSVVRSRNAVGRGPEDVRAQVRRGHRPRSPAGEHARNRGATHEGPVPCVGAAPETATVQAQLRPSRLECSRSGQRGPVCCQRGVLRDRARRHLAPGMFSCTGVRSHRLKTPGAGRTAVQKLSSTRRTGVPPERGRPEQQSRTGQGLTGVLGCRASSLCGRRAGTAATPDISSGSLRENVNSWTREHRSRPRAGSSCWRTSSRRPTGSTRNCAPTTRPRNERRSNEVRAVVGAASDPGRSCARVARRAHQHHACSKCLGRNTE